MPLQLNPKTWKLETERLVIRAPQPGEGAAVNVAVRESFEELRLWMPWARGLPTVDESEAVSRRAHDEFETGRDYAMRIWLKDGTLAGACGLHRGNAAVPSLEIGYWCRTSLAGRGYVSETVAALVAFGFGSLGLERLEIRCDARNGGSRRVAGKCGFELEGVLRCFDRATDGSLRDICMFARFPDADAR